MTSSKTDNTVPVASIGDASGSSADSLAALFSQLNVGDNHAVTLTSALHEIVQNAVIAALQEVVAIATLGAPSSAGLSAPAIPASSLAALHTRTHHGVTYDVPHPNASGPFYWVNRGHHIGVFSTWQQTSTHVTGVSRSSFSKIHSVAEGIRLIEKAIDGGEAEVIP